MCGIIVRFDQMTSEVELKEIRNLLQKLNKKVDGLNDLVEETNRLRRTNQRRCCCNKRIWDCKEERKAYFSSFKRFDKRDLRWISHLALIESEKWLNHCRCGKYGRFFLRANFLSSTAWIFLGVEIICSNCRDCRVVILLLLYVSKMRS